MKHNKTIIIGAGLVGTFWAIMLQELGIKAHVYEKRPDLRKRRSEKGRSVNLVITSRGIHALQTVGLWEKIRPLTVPVLGRMIHSREGHLTYSPYGRDESECNYSISRHELNQFLLDEAEFRGIPLAFNHRLINVDISHRKAIFAGGKSLGLERLFGTDGGGGQVRRSMGEQLPDAQDNSELFPVEYKEMLMPPPAEYAMKKNALHIWPRGQEMLMGLPNQDGSFTMTLFMPKERFVAITDQEKLQEHFQQYSDAIPLMPHYVEQYFAHPQGYFGTVRFSPWTDKDHICLLGDAAHAIVPFFGQGLNSGLEDCSVLYRLWHQYQNWEQVFKEFEQIQRPNSNAMAAMAIANYWEMANQVGNQKFLLRKKIEHKIEAAFPQLYRSRYGMVAYTLIPYHLVEQAGKIQAEILDEILQTTTTAENLDLTQAKKLIEDKFLPFLCHHRLSLNHKNHV